MAVEVEMERLSAADAWFLYLEGPTVHLHVTGLLLLDPSTAPRGLTFAKLRSFITGRQHLMPSLHRRLVEVPLAIDHPSWINDPDFDLDNHLHHHVLRGDGSSEALARFASEFASTQLPRDRPLWDMVMVEGLDDGNVGIVIKMHHCIVDGISGMDIMAHLLELSPSPARHGRVAAPTPEPVPHPMAVAASASWNRLTDPLRPVRAAVDSVSSLARMADTSIRRRLGGADALAHPVNAPRTVFNASLTSRRELAFGLAPLADLKIIRRAFDVTVNDVVLAACTYGLRTYLQAVDEIPDRPLVCSVPVSIHGQAQANAANHVSANQVSTMFVNLPVHLADPAEQLRAIHEGAIGAKAIQGSVGTDLISDVVELVPSSLFHLAARMYSDAGMADRFPPVHNLIVSNVIGSPVPLYMAGAEVIAMYPFGPLMEGTGLNITVLSNNGEMNIGIIACPDLVPELHRLLDGILSGFEVLLDAAGQDR